MPFDNTGTFTRIHSWEQDRLNDISIDSARVDEDTDDIANGLSQTMLRSGNQAMNGQLNMNNYKIQNVANGTAATDAVNKSQLTDLQSTITSAYQQYTTTAISTMLSNVYPVGSLYIGTQNTCPMATLISGSTWVLVAQDKALWGGNGSNANTTIAAGLPNITGTHGGADSNGTSVSGAFYNNGGSSSGDGHGAGWSVGFDASRSNSIYGNSTTVQPPAYRVNVWRRTA